jgi:putative ABC transport system permease protein
MLAYPHYFYDNNETKTEWIYTGNPLNPWEDTTDKIGTHPHSFIKYSRIGIMYQYDFSYTDSKGTISKTGEYGYVGSKSQMSQMLGLIGNIMPGIAAGLGGSINTKSLSLRQIAGVDIPIGIYVYPTNFELKSIVTDYLDKWNSSEDITYYSVSQDKEVTVLFEGRDEIKYSDTIAIIINLINTLINMITIALVSFTSLSLVVSTVMIAIITYVSVVERTKEIGVIRSLGGRKKDVSHLFNAETFIIGLVAGLIGVAFTYFASFVISQIVRVVGNLPFDIAVFPWYEALIMIGVSILLTLVSGLFPSRAAAKQDPVNALRTE